MNPTHHNVAWKLESADPSIASTRYRAMIPAYHLLKQGIRSVFYAGGEFINFDRGFSAVVFVKCFGQHELEIAREAEKRGVPVFLDLCDNVFDSNRENARFFKEMAEIAQTIVVTTSHLAELLSARFSVGRKVRIIPDTFETRETTDFATAQTKKMKFRYYFSNGVSWFLVEGFWGATKSALRLMGKLCYVVADRLQSLDRIYSRTLYFLVQLLHLKKGMGSAGIVLEQKVLRAQTKVSRASKLPIVLWYGRSGIAGEWGMTDLLLIEKELTAAASKSPFELVVLSDNRSLFQERIAPFGIPTRYIEWDLKTAAKELQSALVVVIPNPKNAFSSGKSPNRSIQALASGVNVVATRTNAMEPLTGAVMFDDFENGVVTYLTDRTTGAAHLQNAAVVIKNVFPQEGSARQWVDVLKLEPPFAGKSSPVPGLST